MWVAHLTYENKIKKATIKLNRPVASAKANPKIENWNNCPLNWGFLAVDAINEEKMLPIPIPAPINPEQAIPAPIYFAAAIIFNNCVFLDSVWHS